MQQSADEPANQVTAIVTLLVLGAGLIAMFARVPYFFVIWVIGFAVLVPIVAILTGADSDHWTDAVPERSRASGQHQDTSSRQDALETLRDRYARGELTDAQFERKLDALLETETIEDASDYRSDRESLSETGQ